MAAGTVDLHDFKIIGTASCVGGKHPDPHLDPYPKLVWCPLHDKYPGKIITEDQKASVEEISLDACVTPNYEALAAKHGTTAEHVRQAIEYAIKAGFLSTGA